MNPVEVCERELGPDENEDSLERHAREDEDFCTKAILTIDGRVFDLKAEQYRIQHRTFEVVIPEKPLEGLEPPAKCKAVVDDFTPL